MRVLVLLAVLVAGMMVSSADAKIIEGRVTSNKNWVFVGKMVYSTDFGGESHITYNIATKTNHTVVAAYWDRYDEPQGALLCYCCSKLLYNLVHKSIPFRKCARALFSARSFQVALFRHPGLNLGLFSINYKCLQYSVDSAFPLEFSHYPTLKPFPVLPHVFVAATGSWFAANQDGLTCQERLSFAERVDNIPASEAGVTVSYPIANHARVHIWWYVIADCQSATGVEANYNMNFTNPIGGGWNFSWNLPFDEQGLPGLYLTYFLFYIGVVAAHVYAIFQLKKLESYHPVIQLLTLALGTEVAAVFLDLIHFGVYANNGVGAAGLHGLATCSFLLSVLPSVSPHADSFF
jgi:hypothetical protein